MLTVTSPAGVFSQTQLSKLQAMFSAAEPRPFLVTLTTARGAAATMTIHAGKEQANSAKRSAAQSLRQAMSRQLAEYGLNVPVRMKVWSPAALDRARSVQSFLANFEAGVCIYDPIHAMCESERLVEFARNARQHLGGGFKGIYWSSRWRTAYVELDRSEIGSSGGGLTQQRMLALESTCRAAYASTYGAIDAAAGRGSETESPAIRHVRLCFNLPALPLVAADELSYKSAMGRKARFGSLRRVLDSVRRSRLPLITAAFSVGSAGVATAKLPPINDGGLNSGAAIVAAAHAAPAAAATSQPANSARNPDLDAARAEDIYPGGPGLHSLWRDPAHGLRGGQSTIAASALAMGLSEPALGKSAERTAAQHNLEGLAPLIAQGSLDLKWLDDSGRISGGRPQRQSRRGGRLMQPGFAALLGQSALMRAGTSHEAYAMALRDLRFHFGLPASVKDETCWHYGDAAADSMLMVANVDAANLFANRVQPDQSSTYRQWFPPVTREDALIDRGEDFHRGQFKATGQPREKLRRMAGSSDYTEDGDEASENDMNKDDDSDN